MTVFATKSFARFAHRAGISDDALLQAARDLASGRYDASLGAGVYKLRVAREGGGKAGGFRTIVLFKAVGHSFFVYGFAKNRKANISNKELEALKRLAGELLEFMETQLASALAAGELLEITSHGEKNQRRQS